MMTEEFWANSQLSVARYYGRCKMDGHEYVIVNKEGKDIFECSIEAEKAGREKAIESAAVQQMVVPVPQTALTQNPRIGELEDMIKSPEGWLEFSMSPLWPWCFGNCACELNSSDLRRIIKSSANAKIDVVHGLLDALYCFDLTEGKIS